MSIFFRIHTDHSRTPISIEDQFAGPKPSACWLVGGGPSLKKLPIEEIAKSPIPKMCVNLAGTNLFRPQFWTSYDPSIRFHRSIYLDPGVMKFAHVRRAMDLVPETTFKVCDCPNMLFFERDRKRGFADFLSRKHTNIVDWADSMVQAIDILYHLGFRTIYLAGCEMKIVPSAEQKKRADEGGIQSADFPLMDDFLKECSEIGLSVEELEQLQNPEQYHFEEYKPLRAAAGTDRHYFRIVQYLRLCRRSISLAGLNLISVTPKSRLNDHFPYRSIYRVMGEIHRTVGIPEKEETLGLYRQTEERLPEKIGPMQDLRPLNWSRQNSAPTRRQKQEPFLWEEGIVIEEEGFEEVVRPGEINRERERNLQNEIEKIKHNHIVINEVG